MTHSAKPAPPVDSGVDVEIATTPQSPARRPLVQSAAAMYSASILAAVLSMVNVLITSRVLGPTGRGEVAFYMTVGSLTSQLSTWGVQQAVVNFAGRDPSLMGVLATNALLLSMVFGLAGVAVVTVLVWAVPSAGGTAATWVLVMVLTCVPVMILQVYLWFLALSQYSFGVINVAWLAPAVINVSVNGALAAVGRLTPEAALVVWAAGQYLVTAYVFVRTRRMFGRFGRPDARVATAMVAFGVKAHLGRAMLWGNYRLDQWMLGSIGGPAALGPYSAAVAWSEALFYLPDVLHNVQRPDLVRADEAGAGQQATRVFRYALIVTAPLAVALIVAAPLLTVMLFGEGFEAAVWQLRVLVLGVPGIMALKLFGNALTAQQWPMRETASVAVAFVVGLVLDIALIPSLGGDGAALASAVAYTVGGVAAGVILLRTLRGAPRDLVPTRRDVRIVTDRGVGLLLGVAHAAKGAARHVAHHTAGGAE